MDVHEGLAQSTQRPAELMMGFFDGIKVIILSFGILLSQSLKCKWCGAGTVYHADCIL